VTKEKDEYIGVLENKLQQATKEKDEYIGVLENELQQATEEKDSLTDNVCIATAQSLKALLIKRPAERHQ
jgi:hypothetical protein